MFDFHMCKMRLTSQTALQFDAIPNASYESDSEDEDESLTVPRPPNDEVRGSLISLILGLIE